MNVYFLVFLTGKVSKDWISWMSWFFSYHKFYEYYDSLPMFITFFHFRVEKLCKVNSWIYIFNNWQLEKFQAFEHLEYNEFSEYHEFTLRLNISISYISNEIVSGL